MLAKKKHLSGTHFLKNETKENYKLLVYNNHEQCHDMYMYVCMWCMWKKEKRNWRQFRASNSVSGWKTFLLILNGDDGGNGYRWWKMKRGWVPFPPSSFSFLFFLTSAWISMSKVFIFKWKQLDSLFFPSFTITMCRDGSNSEFLIYIFSVSSFRLNYFLSCNEQTQLANMSKTKVTINMCHVHF